MNRLIKFFPILIITLYSCATKKHTTKLSPSVYIDIDKNKTHRNNFGDIILHFSIINNSENDITILKPKNSFDGRFDFFSNTMICDDIPISSMDFDIKHKPVKKDDYAVIKSKKSINLLMNGKFYDWLSCNSDSVKIKIKYESLKKIDIADKYFKEKRQINETISNIDIYSKEIIINLKK